MRPLRPLAFPRALLPILPLLTAVSGATAAQDPPVPQAQEARPEAAAPAIDWPGESSDWNGYVRHDFPFEDRKATVVEPAKALDGKPWLWRMRFFDHQPALDVELLSRGFHLAYVDTTDTFGSPAAVAMAERFHGLLSGAHGLSAQPVLLGLSTAGCWPTTSPPTTRVWWPP